MSQVKNTKPYPNSILLASKSPRRSELLSQLGVSFELLDSEIDESVLVGEAPRDYVKRMASEKARAAWSSPQRGLINGYESKPVLAADTSVVLGDSIFSKPQNSDDNRRMLRLLSANTHQVMTSVAIMSQDSLETVTVVTDVVFANLSETQIEAYCQTGEGSDKAGGYAIQGIGGKLVKSIHGSYTCVVGLPLYETSCLLDKHFRAIQ